MLHSFDHIWLFYFIEMERHHGGDEWWHNRYEARCALYRTLTEGVE